MTFFVSTSNLCCTFMLIWSTCETKKNTKHEKIRGKNESTRVDNKFSQIQKPPTKHHLPSPPTPSVLGVAKICVQYNRFVVLCSANPNPKLWNSFLSIIFRWVKDPNQPSNTSFGVLCPAATFSPKLLYVYPALVTWSSNFLSASGNSRTSSLEWPNCAVDAMKQLCRCAFSILRFLSV